MSECGKTCLTCGEDKPLEAFYKSPRGGLGRDARCKECQRPSLNAKSNSRMDRGRERLHGAKDAPCSDCGGRFPPYVMDFDHVRGEKLQHLSKMNGATDEAFYAELAKCELVCANCHRIRTYEREQFSPKALAYRSNKRENP